MNANEHGTLKQRIGGAAACLATALGLSLLPGETSAAVVLDPYLAGLYADGTGADATFHRIDGAWKGTSVWFNEALEGQARFSNTGGDGFVRIRDTTWGTGIWGLADWHAINVDGSVPTVASWTGQVARIDHADTEYSGPGGWALSWGAIGPLPTDLFGSTAPQDNWTAHYSGFIRITDAGEYNFGVLYDDGFFLRIWGADGAMFEISSDFLSPRERLGFDENFFMTAGLYRFELGAYDRLQVGAVNLAWWQDGRWVTVPTDHLVTDPIAIPAPGTAGLLLAAVGALALVRRRRKRG